jgi:hypothetical protein
MWHRRGRAERPAGLPQGLHPVWPALEPADAEASEKVRMGNYERLFDEAGRRVRAWEKTNLQ